MNSAVKKQMHWRKRKEKRRSGDAFGFKRKRRGKKREAENKRQEAGKSIYIHLFGAFIKIDLQLRAESDPNIKLLKDQTAQLGIRR